MLNCTVTGQGCPVLPPQGCVSSLSKLSGGRSSARKGVVISCLQEREELWPTVVGSSRFLRRFSERAVAIDTATRAIH